MLPFDFDYYRPDTVEEAVEIYASVLKEGLSPFYYGGGTEIISMGRVRNLHPDAIIDIKHIHECRGLGTDGQKLYFGAAATLSDLYESGLYPLLGLAAGRIADHTIQCRLTLGGNLAGSIYYHETLLPLLLADATVYLAGPGGRSQAVVTDIFRPGKGLHRGDLIVGVGMDRFFTARPYAHIKKSKTEKIGYPLLTLCALEMGGSLRCAASGLTEYPFRFKDISLTEKASPAELSAAMPRDFPSPLLSDDSGSAEYRAFMFKRTAEQIITLFTTREGRSSCRN